MGINSGFKGLKCATSPSIDRAVCEAFRSKTLCCLGDFWSNCETNSSRKSQNAPYKIMVAEELSVTDSETRRTLSEDIPQHVPPTAVLWCSDEASFHLSGTVKKQYFRYWADNNPRDLHQRPLHNPRVTVWCAVSRLGVVGSYFFEEGGETVTVTSNRYCEMLENFLRPRLEEFDASEDFWFQQDGTTAHTARRSLGILREMFPSRLVSLWGDIRWPARSPDFTPCDFLLWGYLKAEVYKHRPQTLKAFNP